MTRYRIVKKPNTTGFYILKYPYKYYVEELIFGFLWLEQIWEFSVGIARSYIKNRILEENQRRNTRVHGKEKPVVVYESWKDD